MANNQTFTLNIKALFDASDVKAKVGDIQKAFSNLKLPNDLQRSFDGSINNLNKALSDFESKAAKGVQNKSDAKGIATSIDNVIKEFTKLSSVVDKIKGEIGTNIDLGKIIKLNDADIQRLNKLKTEIENIQKELANINVSKLNELKNALNQIKTGSGAYKQGQAALKLFEQGDVQGALDNLQKIIDKLNAYKTAQEKANEAAAKEGKPTKNLSEVTNSITQLTAMYQAIDQAKTQSSNLITQQNQKITESAQIMSQAEQQAMDKINNAGQSLNNLTNKANGARSAIIDTANNQARLNTELEQVKSRITYFLGLTNAINLFKRAIRSAFNTVKELDAAMTETAVVTKNTVSDMWAKLPEYTKRANELGVSTLAAYKSATLYYQQGLNDDQAAALSVETLKMARIAGLEAAEATDRMTNALRGFNMELNATNASRVDDVYSQLAAMSASNVDEISTAMTKVASLAHNANMEFETTAAFLAQIIETTRESAETAGTALKTVVARFSEVKKLYSEDQLKGTDEEGQGIDVNRISTALHTAGIDLNKYFLGEVGLDDIFMELASKWDTLTSVQQRYIATQAAGSRQQSRFIALMQDYARTQELVGAAYTAEGASAKQFAKTQDSLESKLARLKNAWNEFLMGITNSGIIKTAVSALTLLLNIINKLTGAFGEGAGGVLKFATAAAAIGGLRHVFKSGGLAEKVLGSVGNSSIGKFFGLGGNTVAQNAATAGVAFKTEVVTAGAEFAAAVRGAAGVQVATGGTNGAGNAALRATPWQALKQFKAGSLDPRAIAKNEQLAAAWTNSPAGRIGAATGQTAPQLAVTAPKTLFGALGNKFYGTKLGTFARGGLAKLGFASGNAAAISGAAALATTIGTITVAAGAAAIAIKAMYDASPTGQLKMAQKYADSMGEVATNTQKAARQMKEVATKSKEYSDNVVNANTSLERKKAINDQNEYILSLLEEDATYAKYISSTFTEGGQFYLTLDSAALAAAVDEIAEGAVRASAHSQLAQAVAQKQTADYYRNKLQGIDLKNRTKTVGAGDYATEVALSDKEYAKYLGYQGKIEAANVAMQNYVTTAASQLIDAGKIGGAMSENIAKAMGETFNADEVLKKARGEDWYNTLLNWDRSDLEMRYQELYGADASQLKRGDLIDKVAMGEALQQAVEGPINELTDLLAGDNATNINSLLEAFIGEGAFNTKNLVAQNVENEDDLYKLFGLDTGSVEVGQALIDLADALGKTTDEVRDQIKERAKQRKKEQGQRQYATSAKMLEGNVSATNVAQYLKLSDLADQQVFEQLYSSFDTSFISEDLISQLFEGIKEEGFTDWFNSIDLSNPIQAFHELTDAAKNGSGAIQNTAKALLEVGAANNQFSASSQLTYFTLSSNYDALTESLDKFIAENGKITSANILELAKSSSDLNAMLEDNVMTAQALAVALQALETNDVNVWELSDSIIAALNAMDDLDGAVASIIDELNNFDPGYDENDITSFIGKVYKNASENIEKGAYGNNVMGNYMQKIFGEFKYDGPKEGYGDAYKEWLSTNLTWLENNQDSMYSAWSDFSKTLTNKQLNLFDESGQIIGEAATIYEQNGEIFIEANGKTTEQLIEAMVQTGKVTETQARMMIADFKNYSADFAHEMAENDLPNAIQAWMDSIREKGGMYDDAELDTLSKLLGVERERIEKEIEKYKKDAEEFKGIKFTESDGPNKGKRTKESITHALTDMGTTLTSDYTTNQERVIKGDELFDYDSIKASYEKLGIPQMFESDFQTILGDSKEFYADFFGNQEKVSIREGQTVGEAYAEAYQAAVNKNLAGQLANAIKDVFGEDFELNINTDNGVNSLEILDKAVKNTEEGIQNAQATGNAGVTVNTDTAQVVDLTTKVDTLTASIKAAQKAAAQGINIDTSGTTAGEATGGGTFLGGATGGVVKSLANGSANVSLSPGTALTGEEGPEIVWNKKKGYAYITGEDHPEFQDLQPGDRVFNAQETKKILGGAAAGGQVPSYARGYGSAPKKTGSGSGSGSGSGGKDKEDEWKNDLDWLYNLMEDIVELERDQKALEEQYEDYLQDQSKTGQDLYKLLIKQLGNLYTQLQHQQFALEKREQEMREFMDVTNDKDQYLWYNWQDRTIEIDWDAIDQITDEDEYKHVKELIDEAEEIQDKIDDADDSIMDITNQIQELEHIWRDTYVDFEKRVLDALVKSYQKVIDNYSELNDTLNDSNSQILQSLQKEIDLQRQIRDNTKTEEEIADDEARLAYLRRDTFGGNDLDALQLEKDLNDQRESYTDTLIDQAIQRLQDDNDAAAQQRERQIEIMQAQLDYQSENGEFNAFIRQLMEDAISPDGQLLTDSELYTLLKTQENWDAMSDVNKQVWEEELTGTFKQVAAFLLKQNAEENGTFYTALTNAIQGVSSAIGSYSQAMVKIGTSYTGAGGPSSGGSSGGGPQKEHQSDVVKKAGYNLGTTMAREEQLLLKKPSRKYATGGLADTTGLAWLDGTPQEPEYVLNARQTDAFLKLADVLPSVMGNNSSSDVNNTFGATTFNLSVNIDKIASDYDVDHMCDLIKEKLYDSGSYRNVNSLSFIR